MGYCCLCNIDADVVHATEASETEKRVPAPLRFLLSCFFFRFKFDSQKMDYVKNVQTAERIAAQWFEDRKMYRSLQGMHNMTYSDWKRAYSDTTGIGLVQNSLGPPPNVVRALLHNTRLAQASTLWSSFPRPWLCHLPRVYSANWVCIDAYRLLQAGVFPGVPGSGPVVDFVIREQRMRDRAVRVVYCLLNCN